MEDSRGGGGMRQLLIMDSYIEFFFVRHGETADNAAGILQGQLDSPLNALGRSQASSVAQALAGMRIDAAYSSDLLRAAQTARAIVDAHGGGVPLTTERGLREWNLGDFEGRRQRDLLAEHVDILRSLRIEEPGDRMVPGGESKLAFFARIRGAMQTIAARHHAGQRVLVVTHGGAMQVVFRMAIGALQPGAVVPLPDNASFSRVRYLPSENRWGLSTWNERSHLDAIGVHNTLIF